MEYLSPRESAAEYYRQCHEAGQAAYRKALEPSRKYNEEVLDIQRSMARSMEIASAALAPLLDVIKVNEMQAKEAYQKAFQEESDKIKKNK